MKNTHKIIVAGENPEICRLSRELKNYGMLVTETVDNPAYIIENLNNINAEAIILGENSGNSELLSIIISQKNPSPYIIIITEEGKELASGYKSKNLRMSHIVMPFNERNIISMLSCYFSKIENDKPKISKEKIIHNTVTKILMEGSISPSYCGFYYLRDAIKIFIRESNINCKLKNEVYPEISKKFDCTIYGVERGIRTAISKSWDISSNHYRREYFGMFGIMNKRKPSPKEYIITLSDRIIRDNKMKALF